MVRYNELRIVKNESTSENYLIIDTEIMNIKHIYDDLTIRRIIVVTHDQYSDTLNPDNSADPVGEGKAIFDTDTYQNTDNELVYNDLLSKKDTKHIRLELDELDLNNTDLSKTMVFVYVYTQGKVDECVPCALSKEATIGVTFSECQFKNQMLGHLKDIDARCAEPTGLINSFLEYKAIEVAIETCNYSQGINYYKRFLNGSEGIQMSSNCNCR